MLKMTFLEIIEHLCLESFRNKLIDKKKLKIDNYRILIKVSIYFINGKTYYYL